MNAPRDFQTTQPPVEEKTEPVKNSMTRTPPPLYAVLRAGQVQPEPLRANDDEEAHETIKRQVRTGEVKSIYLYKLVLAEVYEASSVTMTLEDVKAGKTLAPTPLVGRIVDEEPSV